MPRAVFYQPQKIKYDLYKFDILCILISLDMFYNAQQQRYIDVYTEDNIIMKYIFIAKMTKYIESQ